MRRTAILTLLALTATGVLPTSARAEQGELEYQVIGGNIKLITRFTDGEGGWPGLVRRVHQASAASNGLIGWVFKIDPETVMGRFTLTVDSQSNPPGDADLGIYFYEHLGDASGQDAPVSTLNYETLGPGGETGYVPVGSRYGIVFMRTGFDVNFTYKAYTPMSAEVSEAGFAPNDITVTQGAWVRWTNLGEDFHSVTATDGSFDSSPSEKKPLRPEDVFNVQFLEVGDFTYFDRFNGEATGVIHVLPGPGPGLPA